MSSTPSSRGTDPNSTVSSTSVTVRTTSAPSSACGSMYHFKFTTATLLTQSCTDKTSFSAAVTAVCTISSSPTRTKAASTAACNTGPGLGKRRLSWTSCNPATKSETTEETQKDKDVSRRSRLAQPGACADVCSPHVECIDAQTNAHCSKSVVCYPVALHEKYEEGKARIICGLRNGTTTAMTAIIHH